MFLTWLKSALKRPQHAAPPAFRTSDDFWKQLERERLRSDRNGSRFALLIVKLLDDDSIDRNLVLLAEMLSSRLRVTDDIGLFGHNSAGILLTDTDVPGASKVAGDIGNMLDAAGIDASLRLLAYPADDEEVPPDDCGAGQRRSVEPLAALFERPLPTWKRLIDVAGATVGLILLSPILLAAAVVIKLASRGPITYRQQRGGLGARPFTMLKFRTMVVEADQLKASLMALNEQDGPAFKIARDPRATAIGRLLRKTSIDELPQLWNVLRGDMSLVGPRPLPCDESDACARWQRQRVDVTPGLTCIWQVRARCKVAFADWVRMDIEYIRSRSLLGDLRLLVKTVPAVLRGNGAA